MQFETATGLHSLRQAWLKTLKKGGGPGGDGETIAAFAAQAEPRLARLAYELSTGHYRPGPLRRHPIPKKSGGTRWLSIPCVADRVTQRAAAEVLSAQLEPEFEDASFAYRPGRSVRQAVDRVSLLRRQGYRFVVDADIKAYFDHVPHAMLLEKLAAAGIEPRLVALVALWLDGFSGEGRGLAQGSPISPVLANLYLDTLDETFLRGGVRIVRFADDFVLLTKTRPGAEAALEKAVGILAAHGLTMNLAKTRIVPFEQSFDFLGHMFIRSLVLKTDAEEDYDSGSEPAPAPQSDTLLATDRQVAAAAQGTMPEESSTSDFLSEKDTAELVLAAPRKAETGPLPEDADGDVDILSPGFAPLYVLEPGRRLTVEGEGFAVWDGPGGNARKPRLRVPAHMVGRIDLGPDVEADDRALRLAAAHRIPVALLNGWLEPESVLMPEAEGDAGLHLAQARATLEPDIQLAFAGMLAGARIRNAHALLKRLNRRRKLETIGTACRAMHYGWRKAETARTLDGVRGAEGESARHYWPSLGACLMHGFALQRRREDDEKTPVGIVLDYTAHLLMRDMRTAVLRARLHPGFGTLHASADRRDACVYDLVEPFRAPLAEALTVYLFNNRIIGMDDFLKVEGSLRLAPASGRKLIQGWEAWLARPVQDPETRKTHLWRQLLLLHAYRHARAVEAGAPALPYRMKH